MLSDSKENKQLVLKPLEALKAREIMNWERFLLGNPNLCRSFLSIQFASSVKAVGREVVVLVGYIDDEPSWFLPLQRFTEWPGRFGIFEPVGGVMTDYFGAIAREGLNFSPEEFFKATGGKVNGLLFTHLDETQEVLGLTGIQPRIGLRTRIEHPFQTYWDELRKRDKKLVYDTERREKKLIKERGELSFEWQSTQREKDLAALITLKRSQYSRTGKQEAPLFDDKNMALLSRLSSSNHESCEGVLSTLKCNGEIIAAHFGLRCGHVLHVWFPVYSTEFSSYSPGRILMKYLLGEGRARGVSLFDRGEGETQAKRDFANEEHRYFRGYWKANTLPGWLAQLALRIYWRI